MSRFRSKIAATAGVLALAGGLAASAPVSSWAATPSCGGSCVDPFSFQFGTHHTPNYVLDVFQQREKAGAPVILFRASNDDPAEDWTASFQGTVSDFYAAGLVSAAVDLHYGGTCETEAVTTPVLNVPAAPVITVAAAPGPVAAGTYYVELTYTNASGQTTVSSPTKVTVPPGGTSSVTISSPPAEGNANGWNAYVATGSSASTYYEAPGSPAAIGSNLVLTATPPVSGTTPPASNTATTSPVSSCAKYYPDLYAWELQYAPYGVDSGLCAGLASAATSGEKVTLQPCGVSSKTVWITDTVNAAGFRDDYVPVINGSDTNFSQPFVLDYPHDSVPTDGSPSAGRPQLYVDNLTGFSNGSILNQTGIIDTQEWGADIGVLP